jgi:hypothetical protein
MAAPHVAGALAILRSLGLSPDQAISRLLTTATNLGDRYTYGMGRLDIAAAVTGLPVNTAQANSAVAQAAVSHPTPAAATAAGGGGADASHQRPQPGLTAAKPVAGSQLGAHHSRRGIPLPTAAVAMAALLSVVYATFTAGRRPAAR